MSECSLRSVAGVRGLGGDSIGGGEVGGVDATEESSGMIVGGAEAGRAKEEVVCLFSA